MYIKDLNLSFGTQIIFDNISLVVPENEKVGIVGNNGAGKTTFFKIIMGDLEPDSGSITIPSGARVACLPLVINDEVSDMNISLFDFIASARP